MKGFGMFCGAVCGALVLAGCAGIAALVVNPLTEVTLESTDISDVDLVVAPLRGPVDDPLACTTTSNGFGCRRDLGADFTTFDFRTNSAASSSPFYVYAVNTTADPVRVQLFVRMEGEIKLDRGYTIPGNTTRRIAEIRRNSADGL